MDEVWLPVVGFEGEYEVSDLGRVRSLDRVILRSNGRPLSRRGQILKPMIHSQGYHQVSLHRKTFGVHHLVLAAFVGPRPPRLDACHFDDEKSNNRLSNLSWGTRSQNMRDKIRNGRDPNASKIKCSAGHDLTEANTWINPRPGNRQGHRQCRTCNRLRQRAYRARHKKGKP